MPVNLSTITSDSQALRAGVIGGRVITQLLCATPELPPPERRAELLEQIAGFCMGFTYYRLPHTNSFIREPPALQPVYQKFGSDKL